jgi:PAS domain S-box-containing protein
MTHNNNHPQHEDETFSANVEYSGQERRKHTQSELEKRLKRAMDAGRIFSWEMNPETRELEWSSNMESVIGFPLNDNVDKTFELIHPEDLRPTLDAINEAIETGRECEFEFRLVDPASGRASWFRSQGAMTSVGTDGRRRFSGVTQNITAHKHAEERLRESESQFRTLFNSIDEGFYLAEVVWGDGDKAVDIRYLDENPAAVKMVGQTAKGRLLSDLDPNYEQYWRDIFGHTARTGEAQRLENYAAPIDVWFDYYVFKPESVTDDRTIAVLFHDISERKRSEEALRRSEERLRQLIKKLPGGAVFIVDRELRYLLADGEAIVELGLTPDDFIGKTIAEAVPPELAPIYEGKYSEVLAGGTFETEHDFKGRKFLTRGTPLRATDGTIYAALAISYDISGLKTIEERLRESEERLRLIIESVRDYAIFTTDLDGVVNGWNHGAELCFGFAEEEIIGRSAEIIYTPEDRDDGVLAKEMQTALAEGRAEDERFHVRKDGSRFFASGVTQPLKDGKMDGFVKVSRDMTDRIKAEEIIHEKEVLQKLVGAQEDERKRLARDLHDELGQQLTALRLKLELLGGLREGVAELRAQIDEAQAIAESIDAGVDFIAWELRPAMLDDLGLYAASERFLDEWSKHSGVKIEFIAPEDANERFATETEINLYRIVQEALNNIRKHARAGRAGVLFDTRGGSINLVIEDDGSGFDPENGEITGKGLGLIGIRERAALIGGTVQIESSPGRGTTVYVRVPVPDPE